MERGFTPANIADRLVSRRQNNWLYPSFFVMVEEENGDEVSRLEQPPCKVRFSKISLLMLPKLPPLQK